MKKCLLFLLVSFFLIGKPCRAQSVDDRGYLVKVGDVVPSDFILQLTDGKKVSLKDLKGKVVLLQFTASWCSVCRKEMSHLENEIWKTYKDKGLVFIGIDRDEPLDIVKSFSKEMNISYPLALDPKATIFGKFADKKTGVTRNILINREGKIVFLTRLYDEQEFNALKQKVAEQFL